MIALWRRNAAIVSARIISRISIGFFHHISLTVVSFVKYTLHTHPYIRHHFVSSSSRFPSKLLKSHVIRISLLMKLPSSSPFLIPFPFLLSLIPLLHFFLLTQHVHPLSYTPKIQNTTLSIPLRLLCSAKAWVHHRAQVRSQGCRYSAAARVVVGPCLILFVEFRRVEKHEWAETRMLYAWERGWEGK